MKDYDIKEIKDILKKMQEDINRLENNYLVEYGPAVNNNLTSTQACSEEELLRQLKFS